VSAVRAAILRRWDAPTWSTFFEVPNSTGGAKSRTADAVAVCAWPSRGMEIHGVEVKAYRSDWIRELRQPEKSTAVQRYCDRWWVVAEREDVVAADEVPSTWGLLVLRGKKLVTLVDAPKLTAEPLTRGFVASILRAASARFVDKEVVTALVAEKLEEAVERRRDSNAAEVERLRRDHAELRELTEALARGIGVPLYDLTHGLGWPQKDPDSIGRAIRFVLDGGPAKYAGELAVLRSHAAGVLERVDEVLAALKR